MKVRVKSMPRKKEGREMVRLEFTAEKAWASSVEAAADRLGLSVSAFIRMAITRLMDDPSFAPPVKVEAEAKAKKRKGE